MVIDVALGGAGRVDVLAPDVRRILAPNPSVMTGPGTNTYLVGTQAIAVIDPGPDDEAHLNAVAAAGAGRIKWIVVTHAHPDHGLGAAGLASRTGAPILAFAGRGTRPDDRQLVDGDTIPVPGAALTVLHTPGHASDHVCLWMPSRRVLLTGDHVMHGSTVVIVPPDGDVGVYVAQLRRIAAIDAAVLAPGHGQLFHDPASAIAGIITHRAAREAKIADALTRSGGGVTVDDLLLRVYDDIDPLRLPIARGSLWAHLRTLAADGRATTTGYDDLQGGRWTAAPARERTDAQSRGG